MSQDDSQGQVSRFMRIVRERVPAIARNELIPLLECPVCRDILSAPIFVCMNGHSSCGECHKNLLVCGLCRAGITITRNLTVERILDKTLLYCSNASEGCEVILTASKLKEHERVCEFRPINCTIHSPAKRCSSTPIQYSKYFHHIRNVHQLDTMDDEVTVVGPGPLLAAAPPSRFRVHFYDEDVFSNEIGSWPTVYYTFDERTFMIRSILAGGVFSTWGSVIGTKGEAAKYKINMTLLHHIESGVASGGANQRMTGNCGCACKYEGAVKVVKEFSGCRVFTAHVQKYTDLEDGESPMRLTLEDLPRDKVKINLSRKRKLDDTQAATVEDLFSWSVIFHTYKV